MTTSRTRIHVFAAILVAVAGACGDSAVGENCSTSQDCEEGAVCVNERCTLASETRCVRHEDCFDGEACDFDREVCVPTEQIVCGQDLECPPPSPRCRIDGRCVPCLESADCAPGLICQEAACVPQGSTCGADRDCAPPDTVCISGTCVPGCAEPQTPILCVAPELCDADTGRCFLEVTCQNDAQCKNSGRICVQNLCVLGCQEPGGLVCDSNSECDPFTGRCTQTTVPCGADKDCSPPSEVCIGGICRGGCLVTGCPILNEECNESTGRCQERPKLALGAVCEEDSRCLSGLCFALSPSETARCTQTCRTGRSCGQGFACWEQRGARFCQAAAAVPGATFSAQAGQSCTDRLTCNSAWCNPSQTCSESCGANTDCSLGKCAFKIGESPGSGPICETPVGGGTGAACLYANQCASGICNYPSGCAALCSDNGDCTTGQVCLSQEQLLCTAPGCQNFESYLAQVCSPKPVSGRNLPLGANCFVNSDCADGVCDPESGLCTKLCGDNAVCPTNYLCRPRGLGSLSDGTPGFANLCVKR
jgi:hypothetical protein